MNKHQPRKRFGQNFLHNAHIIDSIVSHIRPSLADNMVEIGPGFGAITLPLLKQLSKLKVIEIDRDLAFILHKKKLVNLEIFIADALKFDFGQLAQKQKLRIVGNLPYNISTPLLFYLLSFRTLIQDMHFLLQKEVVERICAQPNNKKYGRLSVILQSQCELENLLAVPSNAFNPVPKVESRLLRISPKPYQHNIKALETIVKTSFSKRRKTLLNNLKDICNKEQLKTAPVDLSLRAENLSVADFIALSNWYQKQ